jgi:hypothetical protein
MDARIYQVQHPKPMWQVVYRDFATRDGGRRRRVRKHFVERAQAEEYLRTITERLALEGTAGLAFDAVLRTDALAARQRLIDAGLESTTLAGEHQERPCRSTSRTRIDTGGGTSAFRATWLATPLFRLGLLHSLMRPVCT